MTQDPQGFDKEPEVPDAEAATPEVPEGATGPQEQPGGEAAPGGDGGTPDPQPSAQDPQILQDVALTAQLDQARTALHERTQDLQRLQAEFQNYRRRVERDRVAVKEVAVANLLTELLPVLDDIGRARDHGELLGGFKQVAESLEMVAAKMGLAQFGKEGEPFDPIVHEALMHSYSPDVTETTCVQILQPGYRIGERTIRPARVGVAEPQPGKPAEQEESAAEKDDGGGPDEG
ncbi:MULTISPECIES: nucleotide exchange factor GrpE [unclassified Streptomyces]|uniref:Protein GrpE n=1 Tax=Streptomyces johnsoniae TaxID=3075532 RepID=A0ABU2S7W0_9ACTN|nr:MULTISPECIES: nucleotide exchange factor GrpE [unclassified Streptomyces]MDT0445061.1 nucleotide exchange factor GrpE [Streptomyces sp. DSM 41886]ONK12559.1 HSP-70 cofactor [Streptomyces sp. MP131-18]